jgi:hypothetical protein
VNQVAHDSILDFYVRGRRVSCVRREEGPSSLTGLPVVEDVGCGRLFLIGGLVVLSAAALLRGLAGLVRHLVGLAGLVALLLLIRLVLLSHGIAPGISRRIFLRVLRC